MNRFLLIFVLALALTPLAAGRSAAPLRVESVPPGGGLPQANAHPRRSNR
jgi:hypothetical protein